MTAPRVLVTGCAGYIGSVLTGVLLEAGCKVIGVDNIRYENGHALFSYLGHDRFEFHLEDVRNHAVVNRLAQRCDVIIPLAALVGAPICEKSRETAISTNQFAVANLVKSLSPNQRLISPNTNSGYGTTSGVRACTENDRLNPISLYGVTKCEAEKSVLDHSRGVSLRLATVFGASPRMRMDLMVNHFTLLLLRDRKIEVFEPHFLRNFVGVQDVARAFLHMILNPWFHGPYNLGLPTANLNKFQLASNIASVLGLDNWESIIKTGEDPDKRNYLVSNDRIMATGFEFKHDLTVGIKEVAKVVEMSTPGQLAAMRNI